MTAPQNKRNAQLVMDFEQKNTCELAAPTPLFWQCVNARSFLASLAEQMTRAEDDSRAAVLERKAKFTVSIIKCANSSAVGPVNCPEPADIESKTLQDVIENK